MPPPFTPTPLLLFLFLLLLSSPPLTPSISSPTSCRSYCGNITIDYPFSTHAGCGHPIFRQLLFCINNLLLLHLPSGSYRVLSIDYAFHRLTLNDPTMSDCYSLAPNSSPARGFVTLNPQFLRPAPDNVFFLLGCRRDSPLFQFGFPDTEEAACRSVSGMGCEDYYRCPAWGARPYGAATSPPECCSVAAGVIREVNLTRLRCAAYSSAYNIAPVRMRGAGEWSYGIRVAYSVPGDHEAGCRACQVSGGSCGYDDTKVRDDEEAADYGRLCICGGWNSTSTCDSTGIYLEIF